MEFVRSLRQLWRQRTSGGCWPSGSRRSPATGCCRSPSPRTSCSRPSGSPTPGPSRPCWPSPCCRSRSSGRSSGWCSTAGRAGRCWSSVDLSRSVLASAWRSWSPPGCVRRGSRLLFYGGVLLAMSLNRFLLAALSASLPHTIDAERVHGGQLGGADGGAGRRADRGRRRDRLRLILGQSMPDYQRQRDPVRGGRRRFRAERQPGPADPAAPAGAGRRRTAEARRHRRRPGRGA